jgi:hypothetical protein
MKNEFNRLDGLEVFVKVKMNIPLTDDEKSLFNNYDSDEQEMIFDFIDNPAFIDDLNRIIKKINTQEENKKVKCK